MTNSEYKFHVISDLRPLFGDNPIPQNIILEPVGRNTAPAIALGLKYCIEKLGCSTEEVLFVSPADHVIRPPEKFAEYIACAEKIAQKGHIVTFGIKPLRPETGYGYIKSGGTKHTEESHEYFSVDAFTEKPDSHTASRYIQEGN